MGHEYRAVIGGNMYSQNEIDIASLEAINNVMTSNFEIGNVIAGQLKIAVRPIYGNPPRNAKVELQMRIDGIGAWLEKGHYYISQRDEDIEKTWLLLTCYDAAYGFDSAFRPLGQHPIWPMTAEAVLQALTGAPWNLELDPRNQITNYSFEYEEGEDISVREVLGDVATAHAGNFTITDNGELYLCPAYQSQRTHGLGLSVQGFTSKNDPFQIGSVKMFIDDLDYYAAPDPPGLGLELVIDDFPHATEGMAADIYEKLKDYTHIPYEARMAYIDPLFELGDTVIINGQPYIINKYRTYYSGLLASDISNPGGDEIDDEFGTAQRVIGRISNRGVRDIIAQSFRLEYDYNESDIWIEQSERQIARIHRDEKPVEFSRPTEARGLFLVSFYATEDTTVTIRIYVNEAQTLYTPYTAQVRRGSREISIAHSYLKLAAGDHEFRVTMQCTSGRILVRPRAVKYTIDALFMGSPPPLPYHIRDISLLQAGSAVAPQNIYVIAIDEEDGLVILRTRYREGHFLSGAAFTEMFRNAFPTITAKEAAIEFNGKFRLISGQDKHALVTDDMPHIFWIDFEDRLWCQIGDQPFTRVQLASQALFLSAVRGWNALEFPDHDTGLIVAYIKYNGVVAYRTYMDTPALPGVWAPEEILDEAGEDNTWVHVHRLNDYRIGFAVTGCNKEFISGRFLVGQGFKPEHNPIRVVPEVINISNISAEAAGLQIIDVEWIDNFNIIVTCNYPILWKREQPFSQALSLTVQSGARTITDMRVEGGKLYLTSSAAIQRGGIITLTAGVLTYLQYQVGNEIGGSPYWPNSGISINTGEPMFGNMGTCEITLSAEGVITNTEVQRPTYFGDMGTCEITLSAEGVITNTEIQRPTYFGDMGLCEITLSAEGVITNTLVGGGPL